MGKVAKELWGVGRPGEWADQDSGTGEAGERSCASSSSSWARPNLRSGNEKGEQEVEKE